MRKAGQGSSARPMLTTPLDPTKPHPLGPSTSAPEGWASGWVLELIINP
jgi:hypothetical protein